jgi:phosphatidylglycerophosphate synthase
MNSEYPSMLGIRKLLPPEKQFDSYWLRYFLRPISYPITLVFLKLRFSANQVSYTAVIVSLLATILMFFESYVLVFSGAILFNIWAVLDCVDGNVARVRGNGKTSKYGDFIDAFAGYVVYGFVFLAVGVATKQSINCVPEYFSRIDFVLVGAVAAVSNMTMRTIYQHFRNVYGKRIMDTGTSARSLDSNLGITGLLMPAILIGVILCQLHWVILFYALFHVGAFIIVCTKLILRIENAIKENTE